MTRMQRSGGATRTLIPALLLGALAELSLLGVFVYLDEPGRRFHAGDLAYFAVPFVLAAASASLLAQLIARLLRRRDGNASRPTS
jgi:hypothetical protein